MIELEYPFDGKKIITQKIKLKKRLLNDGKNRIEKKIAILGGSTTNDIKLCMELFLLNCGIKPVFYESAYNQYYQEALFPSDELKTFRPDVIYICITNRNIDKYPLMSDDRKSVDELINREMDKLLSIWESLTERFKCPIIQNNFEKPMYRLLGNRDVSDFHGKANFISRLNQRINEYAQVNENFFVCDIDYISSDLGLYSWYDNQNWYMYKYAMSLQAIPTLAFNVSNIIKSLFGKNKKGFVLDLDNTLWGGVVGEDGVDNIEIGPEEPRSQAFLDFQQYLKEQKQLGIILNIDSKNDEKNAVAGLNHPAGILRPDDMIVIKANWESKEKNLMRIADELSLIPDSLVFIDDNPAERYIVKQQFENISAPDIGSVQDYIKVIDRSGFFETTILSDDDTKREQMYKENAERSRYQESFIEYSDYLRSLNMKGIIKPFERSVFARVVQLANKSNQFNLTTKRYTQEEIETIASDKEYIGLYSKLEDKFGDNGIVSVVIGHQKKTVIDIDLWIMSCRVLKRDLEFALMDEFVLLCKRRGIKTIRGYYYPTQKNGMVKDFYLKNGYRKTIEDSKGNTVWELNVSDYQKRNVIIEVNGGNDND